MRIKTPAKANIIAGIALLRPTLLLLFWLAGIGISAGAAAARNTGPLETSVADIRQLGEAGKYESAHAKAVAVLPEITRHYGARSIEVAEILSLQAGTLDDLGKYEASWPLHEQAVALAKSLNKPNEVRVFEIRRGQLESLTNGGRAADAVDKSIALAREVEAKLGAKHRETASSLLQHAYALDSVGRNAEALPIHERVLPLVRQVFGAKSATAYEAMNNFGLNCFYLGRIDEALTLFTDATNGLEQLYGAEHPWVVAGRNNLAVALNVAGRKRESAEIMEKAYQVDVKIFGERHPDTLLRLANLAELLAELGDNARAATLLEKAVAAYEPTQLRDNPNAIVARYNLAGTYDELNRIDEARSGYRSALADHIRVMGPRETYTLSMYTTIGRFERDHGDPKEAIRLWDALVEATEALRAEGDLSPENRQSLFARWVQAYKENAELRASQNDGEGALRLIELSKARTLLESSAVRAANEQALPDAGKRARVTELESRVREIDGRIASETSTEKRMTIEAEKGGVVREYANYRRELGQKYPKYAALSDVKIIGRSEGASLLDRDAIFIDFLKSSKNRVTVAVLDHKSRLDVRVLDVGPDFELTVEAYRRLIGSPGGWKDLVKQGQRVFALSNGRYSIAKESPEPGAAVVTDAAPIAQRLSELLLVPLTKQFGEAKHWIISPDADLATLPFETLPFAGGPLIATRDVSYVQSLSMLALLKARAKTQGSRGNKLLAIGGAQYGDANVELRGDITRAAAELEFADDPRRALEVLRGTWEMLPGSEREVARVSAIFGTQASSHIGVEASEAKLRALDASGELGQFRYLLFSTHGYLSVRVPQLSSVVLSQRTLTEGTDGYITAVEWPGYRLNSELLVLSACETGLGGQVLGEGVMGLPYALYVAGNRDVVLSLWSVVDNSTEEFMVNMFERVKKGEPSAQALANVKREFLKHPKYSAPAYWAPFVLYGSD